MKIAQVLTHRNPVTHSLCRSTFISNREILLSRNKQLPPPGKSIYSALQKSIVSRPCFLWCKLAWSMSSRQRSCSDVLSNGSHSDASEIGEDSDGSDLSDDSEQNQEDDDKKQGRRRKNVTVAPQRRAL